jgi:hypothetical protein
MHSHDGGSKGMIKKKICCGDNEESNQEAMQSRVSGVINRGI